MSTPLSLVVAYSKITRAIGLRTALPWPKIPTDLSHFRDLTYGHAVIMGRRTFESPEVSAIPLPHRRNVVLSRDPGWAPPAGVVRAEDWTEAIMLADAGFGGAGYDDGELVLQAEDSSHAQLSHSNVNIPVCIEINSSPSASISLLAAQKTQVQQLSNQSSQKQHVFVVGGEMVYKQALQCGNAKYVFATEIDGAWNGDSFFPQLDDTWRKLHPDECPKAWAQLKPITENDVTFSFVTFERDVLPS